MTYRIIETAPRVPSAEDVRDAVAAAMEAFCAEFNLCGTAARKAFLMVAAEQAKDMGSGL